MGNKILIVVVFNEIKEFAGFNFSSVYNLIK